MQSQTNSQASPHLPPMAALFLLLAVAVAFGTCSNLLRVMGIDYVLPGGQPLQKIHPATYLLVLASAFAMPQPTGFNPLTLFRSSAINFYIFAALAFIAYSTAVLAGPVSLGIDTWLSVGLFAALVLHADGRQRSYLSAVIHIMLFINSAMGVHEIVTGQQIIPSFVYDYSSNAPNVIDASHWNDARSSGLFGHPLTATLAAGGLAVAMFAQIAFVKSTPLRWFALAHALAGMPCFGGRFAIGVAVVLISLIALTRLTQFLRGRSASLVTVIICALLIASLPFLSFAAFEGGLFNAVTSRIENDDGSAATRLAAVNLFVTTPWPELLFGDLNGWLKVRQVQAGTPLGIEISWLAFILQYGLLMFLLMMGAMFILLQKIARDRHPSCWWPVAFFLLALSSGTGLASKDFSLLFLVCMTSLLFPARSQRQSIKSHRVLGRAVLRPAERLPGSVALRLRRNLEA